ncbi:MAG: hypothetical protein PHN84_00320 [Desulfuromonadaceae bacterium]|nr:hypothetical protein [Desulfuromonadaceae bacterium]MDD2855821.1 hypothetical protein [Desulfuromonadaceae bacterium]
MNATIFAFILYSIIFFFGTDSFAEESTKQPTDEAATTTAKLNNSSAEDTTSKSAEWEKGWELDPYYSNISLTIPLTDDPVPEVSGKNEFAIYNQLFQNSLFPRFVLLEAAVFPMPLLGVGTKKYTPEFYDAFSLGDDLNLLEAVTAGFQEPYAFSLFFGNLVDFVKEGEEKIYANKGYMGYMFSYSNQHIKRNILIPDHNLESEWKLKGDRIFTHDKLSWSFRVGTKLHENRDISDTFYIGFRRSSLDFNADVLSLFYNSSMDFRWDFSMKSGRPLRQEYTIGKKIPIAKWHVGLKLDVGFIWEHPDIYNGTLRDASESNLSAIIRPNIEF